MSPPLRCASARAPHADAIDFRRPAGGQVAAVDIVEHCSRVALSRLAVTAAVAGYDANDVALVDDHARRQRIAFAFAGGADDFDIIRRPFPPLPETPGGNARAGIADGHEIAVRAHPIIDLDPPAAAPAALAARLGVEGHPVDREA